MIIFRRKKGSKMRIQDYLTVERVNLDLQGTTKKEIFNEMTKLFVKTGVIPEESTEEFVEALLEREQLCSTGMQDDIAVPHAKSPCVSKIALAFGISKNGVDFDSMDEEPSKLIFMIAAPKGEKKEHLDLLAEISKLSYEEDLVEKIETIQSANELFELLDQI